MWNLHGDEQLGRAAKLYSLSVHQMLSRLVSQSLKSFSKCSVFFL